MIEAIQGIGKRLKGSLLENLALDLSSEIKQKQHIVIIDYKIFDRRIDVDFREIDEDTKSQYLWVGTADGANSPQIHFTTKNLGYLLSQTIPNLIEKAENGGSLKGLLDLTLKDIFCDLSFTTRFSYRYILDGQKMGIFKDKSDENYKKYLSCLEEAEKIKGLEEPKKRREKEKDTFKELLRILETGIYDYIKEKRGLKKKEIGLFTLKINGRLMVEDEEYRKIVVKEKIDS